MTDELSNLLSESLSFYVHICLLVKDDTTNFLFNLISNTIKANIKLSIVSIKIK